MSKYEVNDKFIIEIAEVCTTDRRKSTEEGHTLYRVKGFNSLVFDNNGLDKLQKYEQPTISEDTLEMERIKALNDGRNEAWELARKIADILTTQERADIFGFVRCGITVGDILRNMDCQEALAKLEAYEKEQAEIKVGDEITVVGNAIKGYVIDESKECEDCYVVLITNYKDLRTAIYNKSVIQKTGKHIDIQSVLAQIGGSDV